MNRSSQFNEIIRYIEEQLEETIEVTTLARMAGLSVYEFRRVFTFVTGVPIGEYIRKRRLSCAAEQLLQKKCTVTELAERYGYDAPSSFSRAFREFHGFGPNELEHGNPVRMFTPINFELCVSGGADLSYTLRHLPAFSVSGVSGISDLRDTECCENVWSAFYENPECKEILKACHGELYAVYDNREDGVQCTVGVCNAEKDFLSTVRVPQSDWMCFRAHGAEDAVVNRLYGDILYRCLAYGNFEREEQLPNVEVFPENMDDDDFEWEIRIPVKQRRKQNE